MIQVMNDCCDCATDTYPCIGNRCPLIKAPHYFCDECGDEVSVGELYWYDNEQLCEYCVLKRLETVKYEC